MFSIFYSLALLTSGAIAHPTFNQIRDSSTISSSQGFTLVANITDLSKDLTPSVNHWKLTGVHVGAGIDTAILNPGDPGTVFFENGTDDNIGLATDGYPYAWGLYIVRSSSTEQQPDPDIVDWVGMRLGVAQPGIGIVSAPSPQVYTPDPGTFIICNETKPAYGRPQYPVKFVRPSSVPGGAMQLVIPDLCAPITLLPQCATLNPIGDDARYNHDYVRTVPCYDDVASIKW